MADPAAPPTPPAPGPAPIESSLPSTGARVLAMAAIVLAGVCGGGIGYRVTVLSFDQHGAVAGLGGVVGALLLAGGVAVVAVLVLRAMTEWNTIVAAGGDPTAARRANRRPS